MNSIRNLAVEFETRTITVSAKFLKQSRVYGSDEFHTMLNLTKELPGFEIRVRRVSKFAHKPFMPTYEEMNTRIRMTAEDPMKALEEFEAVREYARVSRKGYMMVRSWFIDKYDHRPETEYLAA
jgi:hypothetical protein